MTRPSCPACGAVVAVEDIVGRTDLPVRFAWFRCAGGHLVRFCWSLGRWAVWA